MRDRSAPRNGELIRARCSYQGLEYREVYRLASKNRKELRHARILYRDEEVVSDSREVKVGTTKQGGIRPIWYHVTMSQDNLNNIRRRARQILADYLQEYRKY